MVSHVDNFALKDVNLYGNRKIKVFTSYWDKNMSNKWTVYNNDKN